MLQIIHGPLGSNSWVSASSARAYEKAVNAVSNKTAQRLENVM